MFARQSRAKPYVIPWCRQPFWDAALETGGIISLSVNAGMTNMFPPDRQENVKTLAVAAVTTDGRCNRLEWGILASRPSDTPCHTMKQSV
jgi:hypothetical protein